MDQYSPRLEELPEEVPWLLSTAKGFFEQGLHDDVVATCRRALAIDPHCAQAHFLASCARHKQRRLEEARDDARRAVDIEARFPEAQTLLARIWLELGDYDAALRSAQTALAIDAKAHIAWAIRGMILLERNEPNLATRAFRKATRLAGDKWGYWFGLGAACQAAGRSSEAVQAFYRVIDERPTLPHAHYQLGCLFLELDRLEEANLAFQTATRLNPVRDWLEVIRALMLIESHDYAKATQLLRELQAAHPQCGLLPLVLGEVELRQENYEDAVALFGAAKELNPALAAIYYKTSVALRGAGHDLDAVSELQEALRRDPHYAPALLELADFFPTIEIGSMAADKQEQSRPGGSEYEQKLRALQTRRSDTEKKRRSDGRNYSLTGLRLTTVLNQLQALQAIQGIQELMPKDRAGQRRWKTSDDPKDRAQQRQWLMFKADWLESLLEDTVREIEFLDAYEREHGGNGSAA